MTRRETAPGRGIPCWADLSAKDLDATVAFYTGLFGWEASRAGAEYGGYVSFTLDGAPVAGAGPKQDDDPSPSDFWGIYLHSEDVAADLEAAKTAGAGVIVDPMEIPAMGTMAGVIDPSGAPLFLWQPSGHYGFGVVDEPGAPSWFELSSRDYPAATKFYSEVFGWQFEQGAVEMTYGQAMLDGQPVAGLMDASPFMPEGVPSHWSWYIEVADMDASLAKLTELGGSVLMPADQSPFGVLAWVSDPGGAPFKLQQRA